MSRDGSMVSGAMGKISRLCPLNYFNQSHVLRYADVRYFCSPLPSLVPPPLVPGQLPQLPASRSTTVHEINAYI